VGVALSARHGLVITESVVGTIVQEFLFKK